MLVIVSISIGVICNIVYVPHDVLQSVMRGPHWIPLARNQKIQVAIRCSIKKQLGTVETTVVIITVSIIKCLSFS